MEKNYSIKILILLTLFSSTLFSIITPMAEELTLALNLTSQDQVAFINSMFLMVGASFSLLWAILGDKFPRKTLLIIATFEWSVLTLFTIFSTNFQSLLIFQLFAAIGFGASLPLIFSLVIDLVEPENRGRKFGVLSANYVLGNGLGQILSGFLIEIYTWQIPLIIVSISGFICTFLLFSIKEPTRGAKDNLYSTPEEKNIKLDYKIKKEDLKRIWKTKSTLLILILNFIMFIAIGAISSFYISMLKNDFALSSILATIFLIIVFGSQVPSGPFFGKLGDKKRKLDVNGRIKIIMICLLLGSTLYIVAYSITFISKDIVIAFIFLGITFFGAFLFGGIDPLTQATLGEINPPQIRSTIFSINYLAYSFGRSISLLILGQLFLAFNNQYTPGYLILSIMALGCTVILIPILKFLPRDFEKIKSNEL
ncbi:MAG: MFS transporter [Candidatus Lokiarchaeia archaeon]